MRCNEYLWKVLSVPINSPWCVPDKLAPEAETMRYQSKKHIQAVWYVALDIPTLGIKDNMLSIKADLLYNSLTTPWGIRSLSLCVQFIVFQFPCLCHPFPVLPIRQKNKCFQQIGRSHLFSALSSELEISALEIKGNDTSASPQGVILKSRPVQSLGSCSFLPALSLCLLAPMALLSLTNPAHCMIS